MSRPRNCVAIGWCNDHTLVCATNEFCRDKEFSVAIEIVRPRVTIEICVAIGLGSRVVEACDDIVPWMCDRVSDRAHDACDNAHGVRTSVHAIDLQQCTVSCTVWVTIHE